MAIDDQYVGPQKFEPFTPPEEAPPKSGRGCLFWGCLISSILLILLIVAIVALVFMGRSFAINALEQITEPESITLPELALDADAQSAVIERWETFKKDMEDGKPTELALDGQEFNVVAQHLVKEAAGKVHFEIEGDTLKGMVSLPTEFIGQKVLRTQRLNGRFFNGEGDFDVFLRNGVFWLSIQNATFKGQPLPPDVVSQLKSQNLAESANRDPELRAMFSKLSSVEVKDGKFIIRTSAAVDAAPAVETPAEEAEAQPAPEPAPEAPAAEAPAEPEASPAEPPATPETPETPAEPPPAEAPASEPPPLAA